MSRFTGNNGKYFTRQLFWEESIDLPYDKRTVEPMFSLYRDKPGTVNFGKAYIATKDPTGYKITQELLDGDYTLWTVLMNCRWFIAAKELWDRELDAALASEGMERIRLLLTEGLPAQQIAAAKYLAGKEYKKDKTASKGRPSRDMVEKEARHLAQSERDIEEDFKRIQSIRR